MCKWRTHIWANMMLVIKVIVKTCGMFDASRGNRDLKNVAISNIPGNAIVVFAFQKICAWFLFDKRYMTNILAL